MFPTIYWPNGNLIKFYYTNRRRNGKFHTNKSISKPQNLSFPLGHVVPQLSETWYHPTCGQPHSPPQTTFRSIHAISHNYATKSPLLTMGCPTFTPKIAPSTLTISTNIYTLKETRITPGVCRRTMKAGRCASWPHCPICVLRPEDVSQLRLQASCTHGLVVNAVVCVCSVERVYL